MSYDDECPSNWSTYDRVATAAADLRFLLFEMRAGENRENLRAVMGPQNYERAREYLDCVDANLKRMGSIALSLAQSIEPADASILGRVQARISAGDINGAWNLIEAWSCGRDIPAEDDGVTDDQGGVA